MRRENRKSITNFQLKMIWIKLDLDGVHLWPMSD